MAEVARGDENKDGIYVQCPKRPQTRTLGKHVLLSAGGTVSISGKLKCGPQREKTLSFGVREQQRCTPACTSAQSDQCLYYSLFGQ